MQSACRYTTHMCMYQCHAGHAVIFRPSSHQVRVTGATRLASDPHSYVQYLFLKHDKLRHWLQKTSARRAEYEKPPKDLSCYCRLSVDLGFFVVNVLQICPVYCNWATHRLGFLQPLWQDSIKAYHVCYYNPIFDLVRCFSTRSHLITLQYISTSIHGCTMYICCDI